MAYAGIVGVPPIMGLYSIVPALLAYAALGTSRRSWLDLNEFRAAREVLLKACKPRSGWDIMKDPFLNYFALGLLFFVVIVLVYGIKAIHDIPARIAKSRHHPHIPTRTRSMLLDGSASSCCTCCGRFCGSGQ
jgi:uncharacterized protein DUF3302/sulfate permease family protein